MISDWFKGEEVKVLDPNRVLLQAHELYEPIRSFACFSSGNDSLVSTHFSMKAKFAQEVFNINTGIGLSEAREHFYRTCDRFNWPIRVKTPPALSYEEMILKFGFPGPGAHTYPYVWLKQRAIEELVRETKRERDDKIMLITGIRETESARRMGFAEPIHKDGALIWVAPFFSYSQREMDEYIERNLLIRNPVTENLGISGECLCGAFAAPNERKKLRRLYPDFDSYLSVMETRLEEAKQPYCRWGNGVRVDPCQEKFAFMPMCAGCALNGREREAAD